VSAVTHGAWCMAAWRNARPSSLLVVAIKVLWRYAMNTVATAGRHGTRAHGARAKAGAKSVFLSF
jgi:hypothetical protein